MVVRRMETRDFGLMTGWFEEDGTTTTYQPNARAGQQQRRVDSAQVPRALPANQLARHAAPKLPAAADDVDELAAMAALGGGHVRRRSAASALAWNALGFAALFASVLAGRVIVQAGQDAARGSVLTKAVQRPASSPQHSEPALPLSAATALGTLRLDSRPWSQVYLDGRLIGATPQTGVSVPAGRYTVRLANPELGLSRTFIVHVPAGELVTRVESLE